MTDTVLDIGCAHVLDAVGEDYEERARCGATVGLPCIGPDRLPCPAHPERVASALVDRAGGSPSGCQSS